MSIGLLLCRAVLCATATAGSDTAMVVHRAGIVPESIAYHASSHSFFIGDVLRGRVLRLDRAGRWRQFAQFNDGVLGMKVDERNGVLWVNSFRRRSDGGRSAVLVAVDARTGVVRLRLAAPDTGNHLFNDLTIAHNGTVFLTDTRRGAVYRWEPHSPHLELWYWGLVNPNGIALAQDEATLFVADDNGLSEIAVAERKVRRIHAQHRDIDGLYEHSGQLIGIVNTPAEERVLSIRPGNTALPDSVAVLESRRSDYEAPTTGVIVADTLFYIANSQIPRVDPAAGRLRRGLRLDPIVVLRLPITHAALAAPSTAAGEWTVRVTNRRVRHGDASWEMPICVERTMVVR